jgi:methylenetetrahydrofolate reductase (NADPH)
LKTFAQAVRTKDFAISAELSLKPEASPDSIAEQARVLSKTVDAVLLTDNQYGQVHMSPLAAAALFLRNGVDPIIQLSCRNRNRLALLSDLLGAHALGVTSLLLVKGNKAPDGFKPQPKSMMDIDATELIATARIVKEDETLEGNDRLFIGTAATAHEPYRNWQPKRIINKLDVGAQFLQTQLCMDIPLLKRYLKELVASKIVRRASIIVGLATLPSADSALWLRNNRRKIFIPDNVVNRLQNADDPEQEGIRICAEAIKQLSQTPGIAGVSILPMGDLDAVAAAIELSGVKSQD